MFTFSHAVVGLTWDSNPINVQPHSWSGHVQLSSNVSSM